MPRVAQAGEGVRPSHDGVPIWRDQLQRNANRLARRTISPLQWQVAMDQLYADVDLAGLKRHLNFERMSKSIVERMPSDHDEFFPTIDLNPDQEAPVSGQPEPGRRLITKVAHVRNGHSIPPKATRTWSARFFV